MSRKCRRTGKHRYRDNIAALYAVAKYQRVDDPNRTKLPIRAYHCRHCGGWHTTSAPYRPHPQKPLSCNT